MTQVVTDKNTKVQILNAYEKAMTEIKELKSRKLDPVAVKTQKRKAETNAKVKELSVDGVSKSIDTLLSRADSYLSELRNEYTGKLTSLQDIEQAIADREAELNEVYGIEREAESLAALVETQAAKRTEFEKYMADQRALFAEEQAKSRKAWNEEKAEHTRNWELKVKLDQETRERQFEEWKYNHARDEKTRLDALEDALNTRQKQFNEELEAANKALAERIEAVVKREQHMNALEAKVKELETKLTTEVEKAVNDASTKAKQSYGIEVSAIKRGYEADMKVLNGTIENLQAEVSRYSNQIASLEAKLENAYSKVQEVATTALNSQGSARTVQEVQNAVASATAGKR